MVPPVWLDQTALLLLHEESLADFGGGSGLRDEGLLQSALARPQQLLAYGEPDLAALAASYAFGLAKNHPFVDGNKRTAFMALVLFLELNSVEMNAEPAEATVVMLELASGGQSESQLADWIRTRVVVPATPAEQAPSARPVRPIATKKRLERPSGTVKRKSR